jgi:hypothetical protein
MFAENHQLLMNIGPAWAELSCYVGYGSIHDGYQYNIDICENCFSDVLNLSNNKEKKFWGRSIFAMTKTLLRAMNIYDFEQFLNRADRVYYENEFELRYGQTIMNVCYTQSGPKKYKELLVETHDCFL